MEKETPEYSTPVYKPAAVLLIVTCYWKISLTHASATVAILKIHSITFYTADSFDINERIF